MQVSLTAPWPRASGLSTGLSRSLRFLGCLCRHPCNSDCVLWGRLLVRRPGRVPAGRGRGRPSTSSFTTTDLVWQTRVCTVRVESHTRAIWTMPLLHSADGCHTVYDGRVNPLHLSPVSGCAMQAWCSAATPCLMCNARPAHCSSTCFDFLHERLQVGWLRGERCRVQTTCSWLLAHIGRLELGRCMVTGPG